MEGIIPVLIGIVVVVFIIFSILAGIQREKEMREWGDKYGLRYTKKDRGMDDAFPQYSCLRRGHSRYAKNILTGYIESFSIHAFDYHYTTGSGKNSAHHNFSSLIINTGLPLKQLFIRTENFFDKVSEFAGFDDIDFESSEFSNEFYVKSPDKKWAYDVIHQKSMEFLLHAPRFTLDFQGPYIMAYRGRKFEISDFEDAYKVIADLINLLPDYLMRELKGEAS